MEWRYMNIQVQACGLLILGLIMVLFYGSKKIGLFTERVFSRVLIGSVFCLSFDILSVILIVYEEAVPHFLVETVCKGYLILLVCMGFAGLDYVLTDLLHEKQYHRIARLFFILLLIEAVTICVVPIEWVHEGNVVYSQGPAPTLTYLFAASFIGVTVIILIIKARVLNGRRLRAVLFWMLMWAAAALIQFFNSEYLLVGFATALGILTLFLMLENPESQRDRRLDCFNSHALLMFLHQVYDRRESYGVIDFYIDEGDKDNNVFGDSDTVIREVIRFLSRYGKEVAVYKNIENEIVALSKSPGLIHAVRDDFSSFYEELVSHISSDKGALLPELSIVAIDDCEKVKSIDTLFELISMTRSNATSHHNLSFTLIDDNALRQYSRYHEVIAEIKSALDEDRLEVFYQPIYSTVEKRFVSCEALARIRKADGSLLSPGEFIPVAEDTGLIIQIGDRVFTKVCSFLSTNRDIASLLDYVEINLSVAQFKQPKLADKFIDIIERHNLEPSKINLEITETASIEAKKTLLDTMEKFLSYGISFSLDDFGKGQSNLMYVVEMPVSIVKLDMDMSKAYFTQPKAKHVVSATVKMAHDLGLHVVAEGIETKAELDALTLEHIDFIQGYYFSRPVPAADFIKIVKEGPRQ